MAKNTGSKHEEFNFDQEGYEEEVVGFPPYWKAAIGKGFSAIPIALDDREEGFSRWVLQYTGSEPLACSKGPVTEAEEILVKNGEHFSMSFYKGFPLDQYIGLRCLVKCVGTQDTGKPNPMFVFKLKLHPDDKKLLTEERKTKALAVAGMNRDAARAKNGLTRAEA